MRRIAAAALFPLLVAAMTTFAVCASTLDLATPLGVAAAANPGLLVLLFLAIGVAEFGHYWFHRISHENPWVWRLHATHHSAQRLYWLNATRFHPLDLLALLAFQTVPLILAGAMPRAILMYSLFAAVYGQFQHANVQLRTGPLDWLFATPGLHRFHHSTGPHEGNANYGAILIGWDLVFRSFFRPQGRAFTGPVGIAAMPHFPRGWLAQLASPFRWREIATPARGESTRSHAS